MSNFGNILAVLQSSVPAAGRLVLLVHPTSSASSVTEPLMSSQKEPVEWLWSSN
jgi:hypothetical protein